MKRAILIGAQIEGADVIGAYMEGADLGGAGMEKANLRMARMAAANLSNARMEGAMLMEARMEGANLQRALMQGANLIRARMEGANLSGAGMEGADLSDAKMERANLVGAHFEGADLSGTRIKSANWAFAHTGSLARHADFRGAKNLTQAQLDQMIGNEMTLLPEGPAPDTNQPFSIPSCWKEPPAAFVAFMERSGYDWEKDPSGYRCPPGQEPQRTGTPWPLDEPRPPRLPLAERDRAR